MARSVDEPKSQLDATVRVFDQFYNFDLVVEADQFELVYSYFFDITKDKNIANNFSTIMFRIANITGENVLTLLDEMKKTSSLNANALLTYFYKPIMLKKLTMPKDGDIIIIPKNYKSNLNIFHHEFFYKNYLFLCILNFRVEIYVELYLN